MPHVPDPPAAPAESNAPSLGPGRTFSDADADALAAALLRAQASSARTLTDADVEAVSNVTNKKLEEGALSTASIKERLVEPVADAAGTSVGEALSSFEARQPNPADLAKAISDPVVEEVKKAIPAPPEPLKYTEMNKAQNREAIKAAVPPTAMRKVEHVVIKQRMRILASTPTANGDVLTQLCPPTAHSLKNNSYVCGDGYRITLGVMQVILTAAHASGQAPEILRDWTKVSAMDKSHRHACFVAAARGGRHDVRADGRMSLYVNIVYYLMHAHREGVYIKLLNPDAAEPEASQAAGNAYYAYEAASVVCESGTFTGKPDQRIATKVTRGCLIQKARTIFYEFVKDNEVPPATQVVIADTLRIMILDVEFDWHAKTRPDYVGTAPSGPCAWRLLLPRPGTMNNKNQDLEKATVAEMDMLDAVDDDAVDAAAAADEDAFGFGDDDFGIMPE